MPTWFVGVLIGFSPELLLPVSQEGRASLLFVVFLSTFLLPIFMLLTLVLFIKRKFSIKDFFLEEKGDRVVPFLFIGAFYFALAYMLFLPLNSVLFMVILGTAILIILAGVITTVWKISAHAIGIAGTVGFLLALSRLYPAVNLLVPIIGIIIAGGLVLSSRLYLNAHTPKQVLAGVLLGFSGSLLTVYFMLA